MFVCAHVFVEFRIPPRFCNLSGLREPDVPALHPLISGKVPARARAREDDAIDDETKFQWMEQNDLDDKGILESVVF